MTELRQKMIESLQPSGSPLNRSVIPRLAGMQGERARGDQ